MTFTKLLQASKMKKVGFFQDNNYNFSMMRLVAFIVAVVGSIALLVWSFVSVITQTIQPFPNEISIILITVLGIGKPLQKFFEKVNNHEQISSDSE